MNFNLKRRHKYAILALPLYWLAIFTATHLPNIPDWMLNNKMSDDTLHFIMYFTLTFLIWTVISPYKKVNWLKLKPWIILLLVAAYSAFDEYSQGFVGRGVELSDFITDMIATASCLIIMSIFSFWWACLVNSCLGIFIITNLSHVSTLGQNVLINAIFHFCGYALIAILWMHCAYKTTEKRQSFGWLVKSLAFPLAYLLVNKGLTFFSDKIVYMIDFYTAIAGIFLAVFTSYITAVFTSRFTPKLSSKADIKKGLAD